MVGSRRRLMSCDLRYRTSWPDCRGNPSTWPAPKFLSCDFPRDRMIVIPSPSSLPALPALALLSWESVRFPRKNPPRHSTDGVRINAPGQKNKKRALDVLSHDFGRADFGRGDARSASSLPALAALALLSSESPRFPRKTIPGRIKSLPKSRRTALPPASSCIPSCAASTRTQPTSHPDLDQPAAKRTIWLAHS